MTLSVRVRARFWAWAWGAAAAALIFCLDQRMRALMDELEGS